MSAEQPTLWQGSRAAPRILRVSELSRRIRTLLDGDPTLADVWVEGEVSQPSFPPSGHCFFTLKDGASQVKAVLFREELARAAVRPVHGMNLICHGRVRAYEAQGIYQLYVESVTPAGAGDLHAEYEQLRIRLAAEGLFDERLKRPLPRWPRRIGVVTSPVGAVWRDIGNVLRRRYPLAEVVLSPTIVQGATAAPAVVRALERLYARPELDVIILARGGGSLEDLAAFNDERVARAIFAAGIPVISAVGHEVDFTIADFIADLRAPTPSAAAELAVPLRKDLCDIVDNFRRRLYIAENRLVTEAARKAGDLAGRLPSPVMRIAGLRLGLDDKLQQLKSALVRHTSIRRMEAANLGEHLRKASPLQRILDRRNALARCRADVIGLLKRSLGLARQKLAGSAALLDSLSPLSILGRGYAIALTEPAGRIIMEAGSVSRGDTIRVKVAKGDILASVNKTVTAVETVERSEGGDEEGKI